ncbi:sigma factor-like helix-turn-helix DNA-binding protein [Paenibacillus sp.]|uniref:sigma factor-like helix-turn-helix DNA-binding protein n=1 Tax=Paenibacillus sp. TaxID=58172 RepID=UPI0039C8E84A
MRQAINRLDEAKRQAAILFFIHGYTAKEISEHLNVSLSAVESRIRRSKQQLKEELIDMREEANAEKTVAAAVDPGFQDEVMWRIVPRVATIEIPVSNLKRSIEWYAQTFGLTVLVELAHAAMLQVQGGQAAGAPGIYLVETDSRERLSFRNSHTGITHSVIDFFVPDLERFHTFVSERQIEATSINLIPGMGKQGGFGMKDPDGNSLGITNVTLP